MKYSSRLFFLTLLATYTGATCVAESLIGPGLVNTNKQTAAEQTMPPASGQTAPTKSTFVGVGAQKGEPVVIQTDEKNSKSEKPLSGEKENSAGSSALSNSENKFYGPTTTASPKWIEPSADASNNVEPNIQKVTKKNKQKKIIIKRVATPEDLKMVPVAASLEKNEREVQLPVIESGQAQQPVFGFGEDNTAPPGELPGVFLPSQNPAGLAKNAPGDENKTGMASVIKKLTDEALAGKSGYIKAKMGVTEIVPIAKGQINRIVTPFEKPNGVSSATGLKITVQGQALFVATNVDEPAGLFIVDEKNPEAAISVTLIPSDIPPREVFISLSPNADIPKFSKSSSSSNANNERGEIMPHEESLKNLMRELAFGELPSGYSLSDPKKENVSKCYQKGFRITLGQVLEGANNQRILVFLAKNISGKDLLFDEQSCYRKGVVAISAWPETLVSKNKETEVFVYLRTDGSEEKEVNSGRPSLIKEQ